MHIGKSFSREQAQKMHDKHYKDAHTREDLLEALKEYSDTVQQSRE